MTTVHRHRAHRRVPWADRLVLSTLGSVFGVLLSGKLCALRYVTPRGAVVFPVQYARSNDRIVVVAGKPERKRWWQHFTTPAAVQVRLCGQWVTGTGNVLAGADRTAAVGDYQRRYPRVAVSADVPVVAFDVPEPPLAGTALVRSWFALVTLCEFIGFAVPGVVGVLTAGSAAAISVPALVAAGAVEGAALGWGQATVLQRALPDLRRGHWVVATAGAAMLAYLLGLGPSTWAGVILSWPTPALVTAVAALGGGVLASLGTAQWSVLRRHVPRAGQWIAVTATAWLIGLGAFLGFAMPLWQPGQPVAVTGLIAAAGGFLMAAATSAVTGLGLRRVLRRAGRVDERPPDRGTNTVKRLAGLIHLSAMWL